MLTIKDNACTHDTDWIARKFNSCIIDYRRFFKFSIDLTKEQVTELQDFLEEHSCPGWTGVNLRKVSAHDLSDGYVPKDYEGYYVAFTTNDMSG